MAVFSPFSPGFVASSATISSSDLDIIKAEKETEEFEMAKREGLRKEIIERLSAAITEKILQMDIGSADSIGHLASEYFRALGYESRHLGIDLGYCWTKDGGKTYAIKEMDLFEVQDLVIRNLEGKRTLDYSHYEDMVVGLPFNLRFIIRE